MRKNLIFLSVLAVMILAEPNRAAGGVTVTVNGLEVEKTAVGMTFDGDSVISRFSDNSSMTEDMENVTVTINIISTGIKALYTARETVGNNIVIGGTAKGERLAVFTINGRQVMNLDPAGGGEALLDISSLPKGAYIVQVGGKGIKIVKR